jgi:hypothetical protein
MSDHVGDKKDAKFVSHASSKASRK